MFRRDLFDDPEKSSQLVQLTADVPPETEDGGSRLVPPSLQNIPSTKLLSTGAARSTDAVSPHSTKLTPIYSEYAVISIECTCTCILRHNPHTSHPHTGLPNRYDPKSQVKCPSKSWHLRCTWCCSIWSLTSFNLQRSPPTLKEAYQMATEAEGPTNVVIHVVLREKVI